MQQTCVRAVAAPAGCGWVWLRPTGKQRQKQIPFGNDNQKAKAKTIATALLTTDR